MPQLHKFNGAGHKPLVTQSRDANTTEESGATIMSPPKGATPPSPHSFNGDHPCVVTQRADVAVGLARISTQTVTTTPALSISVGHTSDVTHWYDADSNNGSDHLGHENHGRNVAPDSFNGDHQYHATQEGAVAGDIGGGRFTHATQVNFASPDIIIAQWRLRQNWHRAEKSLTLQMSAICRRFVGGDKVKAGKLLKAIEKGKGDATAAMAVMPLMLARGQIEPMRKDVEKKLTKLVKPHPMAPFIKETRGVALLSLAAIIGEAGDVGSFKSVAALWKRFGLAVIKGERQRRVAGIDALEHGYSPSRRSVMYLIGGGLIGGMGKGPRPRVGEDVSGRNDLTSWQKLFVSRLRYEAERDETHRREPVEKEGILYESFSAHAANRARRYVEKRFLAELYGRWRGQISSAGSGHEETAPH
jgi:hypothetical protein